MPSGDIGRHDSSTRPAPAAPQASGTAQHGVGQHAVGDAARQWPERIERARQRKHAAHAVVAGRGFVAGHAVARGGDADRAAGVGADGERQQPVGDNNAASRGRAARGARRPGSVRVAGRAVMRVEADARIGEFGHVQRADADQAGPSAGGDQIRMARRDRPAAPSSRRRHAPDVRQDPGDRHAVERTQRRADATACARPRPRGGRASAKLDEDGLVVGLAILSKCRDEIDGVHDASRSLLARCEASGRCSAILSIDDGGAVAAKDDGTSSPG